MSRSVFVVVESDLLRHGLCEQQAARQAQLAPVLPGDVCHFLARLDAGRNRAGIVADGIELREAFALPAEHGDAGRLKGLQGGADVEDRLGAGADHAHRTAAKCRDVRRDVEMPLPAAVYAADAAGREDADTGELTGAQGGGYRRAAVDARRHGGGQIAFRELARAAVPGQPIEVVHGHAGAQNTVDDGDRCRQGAARLDRLGHGRNRIQVVRPGQAMGDDGGLQCDDRLAGSSGRSGRVRLRSGTWSCEVGGGKARCAVPRGTAHEGCVQAGAQPAAVRHIQSASSSRARSRGSARWW